MVVFPLPALLLALLLLLAHVGGVAASIFNLGRKRFRYEGLINAGSLGLDDMHGQVAAFGDFDGDSAIDLFVVSGDATKVNVHLWKRESFAFEVAPSAQISVPSGRKIVNIVPADFTYDGKLDLLVMMRSGKSDETDMMLWLGNLNGSFGACASKHSVERCHSKALLLIRIVADYHSFCIWRSALYARCDGRHARRLARLSGQRKGQAQPVEECL